MTFIKFCGMSRDVDVQRACELGVHALGFVMWPGSPRYVDPARVAQLVRIMPPDVVPVAVCVTPAREDFERARDAGVRIIQVHGTETAEARLLSDAGTLQVWIATSVESDLDLVPSDAKIVLDAHDPVRHGGTGRTIDWTRAATIAARRQVLLAGGLTAANVAAAIRQVKPFGVDVASGIEDRPGIKNAAAMRLFVAAVREEDQDENSSASQ